MEFEGWQLRELKLDIIPVAARTRIMSLLDQIVVAFVIAPYRREAGFAAIAELLIFLESEDAIQSLQVE